MNKPLIEQARTRFIARQGYIDMVHRDAGRALAHIRKERLWPDKYPSFYAYVRAEWGIGRTLCNKLIWDSEKH